MFEEVEGFYGVYHKQELSQQSDHLHLCPQYISGPCVALDWIFIMAIIARERTEQVKVCLNMPRQQQRSAVRGHQDQCRDGTIEVPQAAAVIQPFLAPVEEVKEVHKQMLSGTTSQELNFHPEGFLSLPQ